MRRILVVGSTNLDIVGNYARKYRNVRDRPGSVSLAIGGTGFNVAANLVADGCHTRLLTCIGNDRAVARLLTPALRRSRIPFSFFDTRAGVAGSAYVAHSEDGRIGEAVTSSVLEHAAITRERARRELLGSKVVALDCNLAVNQLVLLRKTAAAMRVPTLITCVSEAKVRRAQAGSSVPVAVVCLNESEAASALDRPVGRFRLRDANQLRSSFGSRFVVVTLGRRGYVVVGPGDLRLRFSAPMSRVVSDVGAGDALFAAMCSYAASTKGPWRWDLVDRLVRRFVRRTLACDGASPMAQALQ